MGMVEIVTDIDAPLERVFEWNADPKSFEKTGPPEADTKVEVTSKGPIGLGTTFHMSAVIAGQRLEGDMELAQFEENRKVVHRMTKGDMKKLVMTDLYEATDTGTRISTTWDYELPYSVLGRIMDKIKFRKDIEEAARAGWQKAKEILEEA
jgi:hypothetical protein